MTMIIRIGYSGSRRGMTTPQLLAVHRYIARIKLETGIEDVTIEGHHGDCIGGDKEFDVICAVFRCRRVAHPPLNSRKRAWCLADEIREPKDYLARDWDIASETGELLAAPYTTGPVSGSGTWATIGYAVQLGRPARVFMPDDGTMRDGRGFFGAPLPAVPGNVVGS